MGGARHARAVHQRAGRAAAAVPGRPLRRGFREPDAAPRPARGGGSSAAIVKQEEALNAKELYFRERDYIVDRGELKIVDEFTGRVMEGRRWNGGLHQAVEAKEKVEVKPEQVTVASITYQSLFLLYPTLNNAIFRVLTCRQFDGEDRPDPVMVEYYEVMGYRPEAVFNALSRLGWSLDDKTEVMSRETIVGAFTLDRVVKSPAGLDPDKLVSLQGHWMNESCPDERLERCLVERWG